ncbi:peptidoglycan DD-metalloendopeptidase family protein [Microbacterium sp. B2969]|uniref:Peptidoglycan DD-metalloendopeptidase family protein n=1 Tax=Microbacterium alkaliflavum TaxID=3248839 RepID=A0ABW7Q3K9_9MICO
MSVQGTVWSGPGAAEVEPFVIEPIVAATIVAEPVVAEAVVAGPVVAETTAPESLPVLEVERPGTRASRRVRTAPKPIAPEADEAPAHVEAVVPAAAVAWAAAAAAVAVEPQPLVPVKPVLTPTESFELIEPAAELELDEPAQADELASDDEPERLEEPQPAASDVDEFELAARLFAFTGETPVQSAAPEPEAEAPAEEPVAHVATRRQRRSGRQLAAASFSVGVMGIVGLLTVGMTTPADAVAAVSGDSTSIFADENTGTDVATEDIQAYVAPGDIQSAALDRNENYSIASMGDIAAEDGITNYSDFYVNDPNAAIQWPFAVGVPITFGFGPRSGEFHEGADFVPGEGADIQSIAAGTVRTATNSGGGYGVEVIIDHIIDGQLVSTRYAHMLYNSIKVKEGQHVEAGTILGNTGNTGHSFGAHTHFEVLQNGTTAIDPIAWLRQYAGRESLDHW